jgi:Pentapeptide repeats (8 copies)
VNLHFRDGQWVSQSVSSLAINADDLTRRYIAGIRDFVGVHLAGADLRAVVLAGSILRGADLSRCDLRQATLCRCDLREADLSEAWMRSAILDGADLRGADLREADLYQASTKDIHLEGATLVRTRMPDGNPHEETPPDVESAIAFSAHNRRQLEISDKAGCYYCLSIFDPKEIVRYLDDGTAFCPRCGIDSVLGSASGYQLNAKTLRELHRHWF